jgi:hypothetical protein
MNVVLGLAKFLFLGMLVFFLIYVVWLIRRDLE